MPLFTNPIDRRYGGRTHSQLVVSEGKAPAEKWLPSEAVNADVKFIYAFGPERNSEVVIPKGKIVTGAGLEYDVVTEKYVPRIAIATEEDIPFGVNHHNVYQRKRDRFSGNEPTIITRDYIRVPLFVDTVGTDAKDTAAGINFGCMWAEADPDDKAAIATAVYGQYVCSDDEGNFQVADATALEEGKVVGQVLGLELDIPPAGYLEYFTEMNQAELEELIKQSREVPSPGRMKGSDLNIDTFPQGTGYLKSKEDLAWILRNFRAGIPFLTDGYFKARTDVTINSLAIAGERHEEIADVRPMGHVVINDDATNTVSVTDHVGSALFIKLKNKIATTRLHDTDSVDNHPELGGSEDKLAIRIDGVAVHPSNYEVDYHNNMLVLYFTEEVVEKDISITITVLKDQIPGIPTGWDFPGCFGEARILLQR